MMIKKFYPAMSIVIMLTQAGCAGWFGGDKNEYQNASKQAPLEVPPGLSSPAGDDRYVVPDAKGSINASQFGKDRPAAKPQAA
ncbi:MAG: hypothetical protein WCB36_09070, partial [Burkholderiales bacterium]